MRGRKNEKGFFYFNSNFIAVLLNTASIDCRTSAVLPSEWEWQIKTDYILPHICGASTEIGTADKSRLRTSALLSFWIFKQEHL